MTTTYRPDSNFRNNSFVDGKYLDISDPLVEDKSDIVTNPIIVESKYEARPDVLANDLYGNPRLWWVFAEFNQDKLIDPILDLKAGMEIIVPEKFS